MRVGTVSVDGTKIDANASKRNSIRHDCAEALREQLRLEIDGLLGKAECAHVEDSPDPQRLPEELSRREQINTTDADGSQLVLGAAERVLADSGYATGTEVAELERRGLEVLVAVGAGTAAGRTTSGRRSRRSRRRSRRRSGSRRCGRRWSGRRTASATVTPLRFDQMFPIKLVRYSFFFDDLVGLQYDIKDLRSEPLVRTFLPVTIASVFHIFEQPPSTIDQC